MNSHLKIAIPLILTLSTPYMHGTTVFADTKDNKMVTVAPQALSDVVKRGLAYLISQQQDNGGWSQGTESSYMGNAQDKISKVPNVGDTCMAALALIQAGSYPNRGEYAKNVAKAIDFVCAKVEQSDDTSLSITDLQGTRIQMKLGPYVDTFLASLFLSEVKGHMPNKQHQMRVTAALDKVIAKMERNQGSDGKWASGGWAPIHAQALATKGLNRAKQEGASVSDQVLARAESFAKNNFNPDTRSFATPGAAAVPLYAAGATLASLQESINTGKKFEADSKKILASKSASIKDKEEAQARLDRLSTVNAAQTQALSAVSDSLNDSKFVQGFGCNGGEEFLSYLDISETLKANDPNKWLAWNHKITENIEHIQNQDGSWMGQHCITSKTFVTAAAILVLTVDRESTSTADKIRKRA